MSKIIENYLLQEIVGQGQYGKVYKSTHTKTKKIYAIKVIKMDKFKSVPKLQEFTINEIETLSKIKNENVIGFIEMLRTTNNVYLIYEFCNEGNLEEGIKKEKFYSEKQAIIYLQQIIYAFKSLFQENILHRDLKPANILFHNGILKVADFGFCKSLKGDQDMTQTMVGSPIYMAPEILRGENYNLKADIWSIGVCFFEMLFGYCPYEDRTIARLIMQINTKPLLIPLQKHNISQVSIDLLKAMLITDPDKRIDWNTLLSHPLFKNYTPISQQISTNTSNNSNSTNNLQQPQLSKNNSNNSSNTKLSGGQQQQQQEQEKQVIRVVNEPIKIKNNPQFNITKTTTTTTTTYPSRDQSPSRKKVITTQQQQQNYNANGLMSPMRQRSNQTAQNFTNQAQQNQQQQQQQQQQQPSYDLKNQQNLPQQQYLPPPPQQNSGSNGQQLYIPLNNNYVDNNQGYSPSKKQALTSNNNSSSYQHYSSFTTTNASVNTTMVGGGSNQQTQVVKDATPTKKQHSISPEKQYYNNNNSNNGSDNFSSYSKNYAKKYVNGINENSPPKSPYSNINKNQPVYPNYQEKTYSNSKSSNPSTTTYNNNPSTPQYAQPNEKQPSNNNNNNSQQQTSSAGDNSQRQFVINQLKQLNIKRQKVVQNLNFIKWFLQERFSSNDNQNGGQSASAENGYYQKPAEQISLDSKHQNEIFIFLVIKYSTLTIQNFLQTTIQMLQNNDCSQKETNIYKHVLDKEYSLFTSLYKQYKSELSYFIEENWKNQNGTIAGYSNMNNKLNDLNPDDKVQKELQKELLLDQKIDQCYFKNCIDLILQKEIHMNGNIQFNHFNQFLESLLFEDEFQKKIQHFSENFHAHNSSNNPITQQQLKEILQFKLNMLSQKNFAF